MAKFFIHRPVFAIVISLLIVLAGAVSISSLPIAQYPEIVPPVVQVSATYTGANAQVLEETVAAPIEQQINGAEGMLYMRSVCSNSGSYTLQITFDLSRDQDLAMVDVQNRVSRAESLLPSEVTQSGVSVAKQSTQNLLYISIYSEDGSRDALFLSNYVTVNMLDQFKRLNGVGSASILVGQRDYSMRLWVNPDVLAKLGVAADDIVSAISTQNVQAAAGSLGEPPQAPGIQMQYPVNVKGRLTSPEEFGNVIVSTQDDGSFLRVRDVATTELGASSYTTEGMRNIKPAILMAIYQLPSANGVQLAKDCRALLADLEKSFPSGVNAEISYDATIFVTKSIEEVVQTLFEAIVLVLIVVLVFLGNIRATLIPILAVPVSLVGTFAGFAVLGFSINLLTMFGLVLAVGIVVDDAIVVVEAVEGHIERGLSPTEATEKAMDEVSGPVIAIALVLCAVFVPVAFMGGMTGEMYRQFAVTLAISVCLSAIVALTLTPALCVLLLRERHQAWGPFGWFNIAFNKVFGWLTSGYVFCVKQLIRFFIITIVLIGGIYYSAYYLMVTTPTGFIPNEDLGNVMISFSLPSGASLERTTKVGKKLSAAAMKLSSVDKVLTLVGYNIIQGNTSSNSGAVIIMLKDWDERLRPQDYSYAVMAQLQALAPLVPEATVQCFCPPAISGLATTSGVTMELQDRSGGEVGDLADVARGFIGACTAQKELFKSAYTLFNPSIPIIQVDVDRDKLMNLGIPVKSAFLAMQINLGGYFVNQFNEFGRTWRVYVEAESAYRRYPSDIGKIHLKSSSGDMVPLSTVCHVQETTGPDVLVRYNLFRAAEVNAEGVDGRSSGEVMAGMESLAAKELPTSYGYEWTSTAYQEKQASGQTAQILVLGLVFVFLFLAAQYESWGIPFSVLLSMPTVVVGAALGIRYIGMDLNIYVQIGILMLIGLSAKNAILIVEYAKAYYDGGQSLVDAALEAARLRFRPILMTSFAFIMGVAPLAMATGASASCRQALGTSVLAGMCAATVVGIFIIPALYVFVQYIVTLFGGGRAKSASIVEVAETVIGAGTAPSEVAVVREKRVTRLIVEAIAEEEKEHPSGSAKTAKDAKTGKDAVDSGATTASSVPDDKS